MTMPTPAALRDQLAEMVIKDLLGPAAGPEEELHHYEDHVFKRYLVGMLAPKGSEGERRGARYRFRGARKAGSSAPRTPAILILAIFYQSLVVAIRKNTMDGGLVCQNENCCPNPAPHPTHQNDGTMPSPMTCRGEQWQP